MIMIEIDETKNIREAVLIVRREWVIANTSPGESDKILARRLGVSWRTVHRWKAKEATATEAMAIKNPHVCLFCRTPDNLQEHHIINRENRSVKLLLCNTCHKLFHGLNKAYKRPINKNID